MNAFLQITRIVMTPLSPIHIGSGEDFEPTNYVIEDGVLYGFEPSQANLPDNLRKQLMDLGNRARLLDIQKFFRDNSKFFKPHAKSLIPVTTGIAREYKSKIGMIVQREADGNAVFNRLTIERTSHNPVTDQPFIPGSSFKGAMRTAILDKFNDGQRVANRDEIRHANKLETRLLDGDFEKSPLRLLKIADLMPLNELAREIKYAVNRKKRFIEDKRTGAEAEAKGVTARKECILQGQYRSLAADVTIHDLGDHGDTQSTPAPAKRPEDLRELAKICNRYYLPRLHDELAILNERGFSNPDWPASIDKLLDGELGVRLKTGDAFLVRLGRYGGAESKTLSGDGVAQIKIMQGKGQSAAIESHTKTVWLAANNDNDRSDMLPFGWALVEVDPQTDLPQLQNWCQQQAKTHPAMAAIRASHGAALKEAAQAKEQQRLEQERAEAEERARMQAEADKLATLAAMSYGHQQISNLCEMIRNVPNQKQPGSPIAKQSFAVIEDALDVATRTRWTDAERLALAEQMAPLVKAKGMSVGKDEKSFKALFRQLRSEA